MQACKRISTNEEVKVRTETAKHQTHIFPSAVQQFKVKNSNINTMDSRTRHSNNSSNFKLVFISS